MCWTMTMPGASAGRSWRKTRSASVPPVEAPTPPPARWSASLERRSVRKPDHSDRLRFGDRLRVPECDPLQPARRAPGGVDDRSDVESAHGIDPARAEDAQTANEKAVWVFARASS